MEDTVTITKKEYEEMKDRIYFLECLEGAGVDNWDGYDVAYHFYKGDEL